VIGSAAMASKTPELRPAPSSPKTAIFLTTFVVGYVLDQITKQWVIEAMHYGRVVSIVPGFFDVTHVRNPGGAWSLFAQGDASCHSKFFREAPMLSNMPNPSDTPPRNGTGTRLSSAPSSAVTHTLCSAMIHKSALRSSSAGPTSDQINRASASSMPGPAK